MNTITLVAILGFVSIIVVYMVLKFTVSLVNSYGKLRYENGYLKGKLESKKSEEVVTEGEIKPFK